MKLNPAGVKIVNKFLKKLTLKVTGFLQEARRIDIVRKKKGT